MDSNLKHIDPNKIHLLFIEEVQVVIDELPESINAYSDVNTSIAHRSGYNLEESKFFLGIQLNASLSNDEDEFQMKFRFNFHFRIDNLKEMYSINRNGSPVFARPFVATLAGISYSTLRGIVFERVRVNSSWNVLLPVINPNTILDSWIKAD